MTIHVHAYAQRLADRASELLAPYCERIEAVGELRRGKNEISEIDLLLVPKILTVKVDMFATREDIHPGLLKILNFNPQLKFVKGNPSKLSERTSIVRQLTDGTVINFYFTELHSWGSALALKTGPYSAKTLIAQKCSRKRYYIKNARIFRKKDHIEIPFPDEQLFFETLKIPYYAPKDRYMLKPQDLSWIKKSSKK